MNLIFWAWGKYFLRQDDIDRDLILVWCQFKNTDHLFIWDPVGLKSTYHFYCWFQGNKTRYHLYIHNHHIGDRTAPSVTVVSKRKGVRFYHVKESQISSFKIYHKPVHLHEVFPEIITYRGLCFLDMYDIDI